MRGKVPSFFARKLLKEEVIKIIFLEKFKIKERFVLH